MTQHLMTDNRVSWDLTARHRRKRSAWRRFLRSTNRRKRSLEMKVDRGQAKDSTTCSSALKSSSLRSLWQLTKNKNSEIFQPKVTLGSQESNI